MKQTRYEKIYRDLIHKLKSNLLQPGDRLLSTRYLAKLYQCHRFTVMKVCQDLVAEGWIETEQRSQYRVSIKAPIIKSSTIKDKTSRIPKSLESKLKKIPIFDLERTQYPLEFWGGQPDLRLFPQDDFRRVLSAGLRRAKPAQLNYGYVEGLESCLKEVSEYLRRSRNLINKKMLMTHGSQEALTIIFQAFLKPGDKIAVEKKGYPPAWKLFENLGAKLIPISVDMEGINTDELKRQAQKHHFKMIYVTPLHQYPTTVTLSPRRRRDLIQFAEENIIPILEDDYDHEFHYIGPPPSPLSVETNLGLYLCSFSKILFPGARLGVVACDPRIFEALCYQKFLLSRQTDVLSQIGLSAWIKDGGFEKHLRRMRRIYEQRYYFMQEELEKIKSKYSLEWIPPSGGMSLWVNLNRDSAKVAEAAKKKGVFFQHESSMDHQGDQGTHLRIGFAVANENQIKEGLQVLKQLL